MKLRNLMPIKRSNGRTDWYFRRKGHPLVRLPDLPHDDPKFLAAYASAAEAVPERKRASLGSIAGLIEAAMASDRYLSRSKVYRATLRRHLRQSKPKLGQRLQSNSATGTSARMWSAR